MEILAVKREDFLLSTDAKLQQLGTVHEFMKRTHWAANRTRETVAKSIEHSLCFGIYLRDLQVAFARVVTDHCTFAYLCAVDPANLQLL